MSTPRLNEKRYNVSLGPDLDDNLEQVAKKLHISKAEVMRRALSLFSHAVEADAVMLVNEGRETQVLIK